MRARKQNHGSEPSELEVPAAGRSAAGGGDRVLQLQRDYGNAAVTTVVQRRERPQSTDAPSAKKGKKKVEKKAAEDDFSPKEAGAAATNSDPGWLINQGNTYKQSAQDAKTEKGRAIAFDKAADYYLGAVWINPSRLNATYLYNLYKLSGDKKREQYWLKVQNGLIVLKPHKAGEQPVEDMTGKEF